MSDNNKENQIEGNQSPNVAKNKVVSKPTYKIQQPPKIFKLNVDCFEHLFEWLSLKDLLAFRRTCKRMKQVVDYYIKLNYPRMLNLDYSNWTNLAKLSVSGRNFLDYIKYMHICTDKLAKPEIDNIHHVFSRLESITLSLTSVHGDFYEVFLKFCTNLKFLSIQTSTMPEKIIGNGNDWLLCQYPALEHIELHVDNDRWDEPLNCIELLTFFERNPKVQTFSTSSQFLLAIGSLLMESNITLNRLIVRIDDDLGSLCDILNKLHKHGFYKRLHIFCYSDIEKMHHIPSLCALEKLFLWTSPESYRIPVLRNLKELSMNDSECIPNDVLKSMATNFVNLKRIYIRQGIISNIRLFASFTAKVEQIVIGDLTNDDGDDIEFSDFVELNNDRKKLAQAQKIMIYIDEELYLKLKWTATIKFSMIELGRANSYKGDHFFE